MITADDVETAAAPGARRSRRRRASTWVALAVGIALVALLAFFVRGAFQTTVPGAYEPDNHGPNGYRALVQVLRDQGVDVQVTRSWRDAADRLNASGGTLVLGDAPALTDDALRDLWRNAQTVVLLSPGARQLEVAIAGARPASWGAVDAVTAGCDFAPAAKAEQITPSRTFTGGQQQCFPGTDGFGLIAADVGGTGFVAVAGDTLFTNERILRDGNAALGLGLLGEHDTMVWYLPSFGDTDRERVQQQSIRDLAPDWVTPVMVLAMLTAAAAAIWRGRRFGPLVAERLPVTVRAAETMQGRARLYARGRDAAHAGGVLRRASTQRIARTLGMGSRTQPEAVADATAAAIGASRDQVRRILVGPLPTGDQDLLDLSDRLIQLERAVRAAIHTERAGS